MSGTVIIGQHLKIKFPVEGEGVGEMLGSQSSVLECNQRASRWTPIRIVTTPTSEPDEEMGIDPADELPSTEEPSIARSSVASPLRPVSSVLLPVRVAEPGSDFDPRIEALDHPSRTPGEGAKGILCFGLSFSGCFIRLSMI